MFASCFDELVKIALVRLSPEEKRRQALQFAGLGTVTIPTMTAVSSKMITGKWLPRNVKFKRWLPGVAATGLFWGGALPAIHHMMARRNLQKASERVATGKTLRKLAPEGVPQALRTAVSTPEIRRI